VISTSLNISNTTELINGFLNRCRTEHRLKACLDKQTNKLPARVLDVGNSEDDGIRLHESVTITDANAHQQPEEAHYVALSYCWGKKPIFKLLKSNIHAMKQGVIDCKTLPQTYRDAISLTRSLGVKYLWIDALCIIQDKDDSSDWANSCAEMDSIYANAYLTLSVDMAEDAYQGIFISERVSRDRLDTRCATFNMPTRGGKAVPVYIRSDPEHTMFQVQGGDQMDELLEAYPLMNRGWTLQERMLSTRSVHFTTTEVVWECRSGAYCECEGVVFGMRPWDQANCAPEPPGNMKIDFSSRSKHWWWSIVEDYSSRNLTHADDRLAALSGVARRFGKHCNARYLAGLWSNDMPYSILWRPVRDAMTTRQHSNKRIGKPTWSWASVDSPITEYPRSFLHDCECLVVNWQTRIEAATVDDFGTVKVATLELSVPLLKTQLQVRKRVKDEKIRGLEALLRGSATCLDFSEDIAGWSCGDWMNWDDAKPNEPLEWNTLIPIDVYCATLYRHPGRKQLVSMVLVESKTEHGQFERVGSFSTFYEGDEADMIYDSLTNATVRTIQIL
jgi:hypothetical protein